MKKTVLICEDDEGIVEVTTIVIEGMGYNVESATKGSEVLKMIHHKKPDLLLLDLWMPEMTGEEIAATLKSKVLTQDIPIVFISASRDLKKIAKDSHVNDFLPKPFDIKDLESMVGKYIH